MPTNVNPDLYSIFMIHKGKIQYIMTLYLNYRRECLRLWFKCAYYCLSPQWGVVWVSQLRTQGYKEHVLSTGWIVVCFRWQLKGQQMEWIIHQRNGNHDCEVDVQSFLFISTKGHLRIMKENIWDRDRPELCGPSWICSSGLGDEHLLKFWLLLLQIRAHPKDLFLR